MKSSTASERRNTSASSTTSGTSSGGTSTTRSPESRSRSLLVTSRERLRLSGERVVEVPPLEVPEVVDDADVLRRSDAVELFIDRARAAASELDLDHDELETIAEICRRLDGIPLAIELAASRTKVVGPQ